MANCHRIASKLVEYWAVERYLGTKMNQFSAEDYLRMQQDLIDSFDEELELELSDQIEDGTQGEPQSPEEANARKHYFRELFRLQGQLIQLQDWVTASGHRLVVLFEGRDAAGKGGVIKRITQRLNPRVCRVAALQAPTEKERSQWYFQRYVAHLPAAGEIVLFDRSWYNRAGVEKVMGFCTEEEYEEFFRSVPEFEKMLKRAGIQLIKYWFSITDNEQHRRFVGRMHDPLKQWKLSPHGSRVAPPLGGITRASRKPCWLAPISPRRCGGWCRPMTRSARASTASIIFCIRCPMPQSIMPRCSCPSASTTLITFATRCQVT